MLVVAKNEIMNSSTKSCRRVCALRIGFVGVVARLYGSIPEVPVISLMTCKQQWVQLKSYTNTVQGDDDDYANDDDRTVMNIVISNIRTLAY